jgi:casein kinase II subunit alpha
MLHKCSYQKKPWSNFITQTNENLATKDALDLLSKMLVVDHHERIGTEDALKHPFFAKSL